ncbi:uncharacterized protein LOC122837472, partial [Tachysurus ichikawai]
VKAALTLNILSAITTGISIIFICLPFERFFLSGYFYIRRMNIINMVPNPEAYVPVENPSSAHPQEDIEKWPYLQNVKLHGIDAEVELHIGADAAKVMELINSQDEGPYAVWTRVGWVINGPLGGEGRSKIGCTAVIAESLSFENPHMLTSGGMVKLRRAVAWVLKLKELLTVLSQKR